MKVQIMYDYFVWGRKSRETKMVWLSTIMSNYVSSSGSNKFVKIEKDATNIMFLSMVI